MSSVHAVDWLPVMLAGALAFGESALGLGAVLPGEVAVVGIATTLDAGSTPVAVLVVAIAASMGDHVGYLLGRRFGPRLSTSRPVERLGPGAWAAGARLMRRHGVAALLVSRLLPFVRTVMPAVAGAARLRYSRFLAASLVGSLLWSGLWVGAGGLVAHVDVFDSPAGLGAAVLAVVGLLAAGRSVARRVRSVTSSEGIVD